MLGYDSYIDSQIPYVGLIPSHWKVTQNKRVRKKEFVRLIQDKTFFH